MRLSHSLTLPVLLIPCCLLGCDLSLLTGGDDDDDAASSSSGGYTPTVLAEIFRQGLLEQCAFEERCAATRGRAWSSLEACQAWAEREADATQGPLLGMNYYQWIDIHFDIADEARARACVAKIAQKQCNDSTASDPECDHVFKVRNPQAVGQPCTSNNSQALMCDESSFCSAVESVPGCKVCRALKNDGETCLTADECTSGFCGGSPTPVCGPAALKAKGESCAAEGECLGNLVCAGAAGGKTCMERLGSGAACDGPSTVSPTRPPCFEDLECVPNTNSTNGTCMKPRQDGSLCVRDVSTGLGCQHYCVFAAPTDGVGYCKTIPALPGPGEPCVGHLQHGAFFCAKDDNVFAEPQMAVRNNSLVIIGCECKTKVANGQPCTTSSGCAEGRCKDLGIDDQGDLKKGTCEPKLGNGEACLNAGDCLSGSCEVVEGTAKCVPAAVCQAP